MMREGLWQAMMEFQRTNGEYSKSLPLTPKYHSLTFSALHNAMERKRRDSIKDSFRGLQVHFFILQSVLLATLPVTTSGFDTFLFRTVFPP